MAMSLGLALPKIEQAQRKAVEFVGNVYDRHDLSRDETPEDLRDRSPRFWKTREGKMVSATLSLTDLHTGDESTTLVFLTNIMPAALMMAGLLGVLVHPVVGVLFAGIYGLPLFRLNRRQLSEKERRRLRNAGSLSRWFRRLLPVLKVVLHLFVPVLYVLRGMLSIMMPVANLAHLSLNGANKLGGNQHAGDTSGMDHLMMGHVTAREEQRKNALRDKSAMLYLGISTGTLSGFGSNYAPDANNLFGLSANDLSTHLFVFGRTGSGKTSGVLRPLFGQWRVKRCGGALLMCGKGTLPAEFAGTEGYTLLSPGHAKYALIAGLMAEDVADIIPNVMREGSSRSDPFFDNNGAALLRAVAVLQEAAHASNPMDFPWTLLAIREAICNDKRLAALVAEIENSPANGDLENDNTIVGTNYRFIKHRFLAMEAGDKTREGIVGTADGWLVPILGHRELIDWASSEEGVDPTSVCEGAMIGVAVQPFRYGQAVSRAISQLIKARVYRAVRNRGDNWKNQPGQTPVMVMIDECQDGLIGQNEFAMAAQGRSLGVRLVLASQHIEGVMTAMGNANNAKTLLGNQLSVISLDSTPETIAYVCSQLGTSMRVHGTVRTGTINYAAVGRLVADDQVDSSLRDSPLTESLVGAVALRSRSHSPYRNLDELYLDMDGVEVSTQAVRQTMEYKIGPTLRPEEAHAFLRTPFTAIAQVMRGGVIRHDIIKLEPEFTN